MMFIEILLLFLLEFCCFMYWKNIGYDEGISDSMQKLKEIIEEKSGDIGNFS